MLGSGPQLALLLLGGFRVLVDEAVAELARRGHKDVRPVHDFAMRAIIDGADSASELGRRLSVSKQAAAKTISLLQARGYVDRVSDATDARCKRLRVTKRGFAVLHAGEEIFDELRNRWARKIGAAELEAIESHLSKLVGSAPGRLDDMPGWLSRGQGD